MANKDILLGDGPIPHGLAPLKKKKKKISSVFQIKFKDIDRLL